MMRVLTFPSCAISAALSFADVSPAQAAPCRLALALGLDVSGSVDAREYRAQRDGLAWALRDPDLRALLIAPPEAPVEITVFEWSGPGYARALLGWTSLTSVDALEAVADRVANAPGGTAPLSTAVGSARQHGLDLLATRDCARKVLDLSADGISNAGPRPQDLPAPPWDVTVNALLIGDAPGLHDWFAARVIHGPGAFIEEARNHMEYGPAMRRKLMREAAPPLLGQR